MINGVVGPHGDGYDSDMLMPADEAERYHSQQIGAFSDTVADMVSAITMTCAEEAIGIAQAARSNGMPTPTALQLLQHLRGSAGSSPRRATSSELNGVS